MPTYIRVILTAGDNICLHPTHQRRLLYGRHTGDQRTAILAVRTLLLHVIYACNTHLIDYGQSRYVVGSISITYMYIAEDKIQFSFTYFITM